MKDVIESLPEYFVCKKDKGHNIKYDNGSLILGERQYNETSNDEKYIIWSVLKHGHQSPPIPTHISYLRIYEEWCLYGKSSSSFFETFSTLLNRYSKDDISKTRHKNIIQQLQYDVTRKK